MHTQSLSARALRSHSSASFTASCTLGLPFSARRKLSVHRVNEEILSLTINPTENLSAVEISAHKVRTKYTNGRERRAVKGEVKPKIKISPVVVFRVLSQMVLVRGSWDTPFLLYSQSNSRTSTETGWLRPTRWRFVCKMSLKAPFRSYKSTGDQDRPICCTRLDAESTGFGPKRLRCSVRPLFPIEHGWTSGHVLLRAPVTWSTCLQATTYRMSGRVSVTRVEPLNFWVEPRCESCRLLAWWLGDWCTQEHETACSTMFVWE